MSCSSKGPKLDRDSLYEHTLKFTIDKKKEFIGVGVLDPKASQLISIKSNRSDLDYAVLESNHRNVTVEDEGSRWKYKFNYSAKVESGLVTIKGFDEKGQHTYGAFAIRNPDIKLEATIYCNGNIKKDSTYFCQSKAGLLQYIEFKNEVVLTQDNNLDQCYIKAPETFKELEFTLGKDFCLYTFTELKSGEQMKLHTYAYELPMIPSGNK